MGFHPIQPPLDPSETAADTPDARPTTRAPSHAPWNIEFYPPLRCTLKSERCFKFNFAWKPAWKEPRSTRNSRYARKSSVYPFVALDYCPPSSLSLSFIPSLSSFVWHSSLYNTMFFLWTLRHVPILKATQ